MKYIVIKASLGDRTAYEFPVIFPNALVHAAVAEALKPVVQKMFADREITIVSAGELSSLDLHAPFGKSATLGLQARPQRDRQLIRVNDYGAAYIEEE